MVQTKHYNIQDILDNENTPGTQGHVARQLLLMHRHVLDMTAPVVLECGVNQGYSTGLFALACEQNGGQLYSVDIEDCSDAITSDVWTFIQSDDSEQAYIFEQAPQLKQGIDFLYIDSLHAPHHVTRLLMLYYPYIKQGGIIAVDDVDPLPYMRGQRKDNLTMEIVWRKMGDRVREFFYANQDDLRLEMHYGSTGLALMHKFSALGTQPASPSGIRPRRFSLKESIKALIGR